MDVKKIVRCPRCAASPKAGWIRIRSGREMEWDLCWNCNGQPWIYDGGFHKSLPEGIDPKTVRPQFVPYTCDNCGGNITHVNEHGIEVGHHPAC